MLRSLLSEIVRRRLWPIPLLAVIVAVAAPMMFMKSAPTGAPSADLPAPAPAKTGKLPKRAERLLATSDSAAAGKQHVSGTARDPFTPRPNASSATKSETTSTTPAAASSSSASTPSESPAPGTTTSEPIPVGTTTTTPTTPSTPSSSSTSTTPSTPIGGDETPSSTVSAASVDVRYGAKLPTRLNRSIPRLATFVAGGNIVAVFVKYSPKRAAAVFAISPSTIVTGDVQCRRLEGLCRYVDIPVGKHARLSWHTADGSVMSRRIDVVRVTDGSSSTADAQAASQQFSTDADTHECLLGKLLALGSGELVAADSCDR